MASRCPAVRPAVPHFSSGPCAKRPGWNLSALKDAFLGRSHRAKGGKAKLKRAIEETRAVLEVPADFLIGIVPASDTGAVEMAMWSMLGAAAGHHDRVGIVRRRLGDRCRQAAQAEGRRRVIKAPYGELPDLSKVDPEIRHRVHLERHDLGRARAECRLDRGRPRRHHDLRCDLGGVRAAARLGESSMS